MLSLNDSFWIILATCRNGHVVTFYYSKPKVKMKQNEMENSPFVFLLKRATFLSRAVQLHPMYPLSYVTNISQNYIPLSYPHYIHQKKFTQKIDKLMIYVMIESEVDMTIHKRADMIIHKYINA